MAVLESGLVNWW